MERINQDEYNFYIVGTNKITGKRAIESGWEYLDDARDQLNQLRENGIQATVIMGGVLLNLGYNVDDNAQWGNLSR